MMFTIRWFNNIMNIKDNFEIINFLKSLSNVYKDNGNEIIIHCPYCDDALRANAKSHGHLYISNKTPVFHCFRCDTSGHLSSLLKDLGFTNTNILADLGNTKYSFSSEKLLFNQKIKSEKDKLTFFDFLRDKKEKFKKGDIGGYNLFERYIYSRLGMYCDIDKYLIIPEMINGKVCASFFNKNTNFVTSRIIETTTNFRYIRNKDVSELYFFQEMDFDDYTDIVLTEGVFDNIKLYRFCDLYPRNQTFFLSILGKNYGKIIKWLVSQHIPIGKYNIHVVFDKDNKFYKKTYYFCKKIVKNINQNINVYGYMPIISNDCGEYPFIQKIF